MRQRMAQSKYVSTRETTNLARIVRIILGPCTDILCAVLTKEIQPCTLVQNVKTFIAKQKKPPITQKQQLLVNAGNYSDFDISLLYFLLRNVCSIPPHVQQWGKDPLYQDRGLSANIERIRIVRNKNYGHVTQFSLSDADFEQQWKTIFQIVRDLESYLGTDTEYQNALTELKTCCMDPEAEETFLKKLQGNSLDLNEFENVELIRNSVAPGNVEGLKKMIDYLNSNVFSFCENYEHAVGILELYHCITIIGPNGSGKTLTAVKLAYQKCGQSQLYFCQSLEEISDIAEKNKGAYIIVDDWIDEYVYYPSKIDNAKALLDSVYEKFVRSREVYLILTAQEDKWNRFRESLENCLPCNKTYLFKIEPKKFTYKDRQNIIRCHVEYFSKTEGVLKERNPFAEINVDEKTINAMAKRISDVNGFSFPVIIDLFYTNKRLRLFPDLLLKDEFSYALELFFDHWSRDNNINEKRSFCILIFAALLGGKVSFADFKSHSARPQFDEICKHYKCSNITEIEYLLLENDRLRSCLYQTCCRQNEPVFIFQHRALFRFVLSYIKKRTEDDFFIQNAHIDVLLKRCWIEESIFPSYALSHLKPPIGSVILQSKDIKTLIERIHSEREEGYQISDWDNHIFMRHMTFKTYWLKKLSI